MNVCIYTLSNIDLSFKTGNFIRQCTTTTFFKIFAKLKYCAARVQSKTDRTAGGWVKGRHDFILLSPWSAATGAASTDSCVYVDLHGIAMAIGV